MATALSTRAPAPAIVFGAGGLVPLVGLAALVAATARVTASFA